MGDEGTLLLTACGLDDRLQSGTETYMAETSLRPVSGERLHAKSVCVSVPAWNWPRVFCGERPGRKG